MKNGHLLAHGGRLLLLYFPQKKRKCGSLFGSFKRVYQRIMLILASPLGASYLWPVGAEMKEGIGGNPGMEKAKSVWWC